MRVPWRMGGVGFGWIGAGDRTVRVLGVLAFVGSTLVLAPAAFANGSSLTWAGGSAGRTESAAQWSAGANWEGGTAPAASQDLESLIFPELGGKEACVSEPETDTCYLTLNDVRGLSTESMHLDDADDYLLAGEEIALGQGGLTASAEGGRSAVDFVEMPLQLSTSQKWSIANRAAGGIGGNGVLLGGPVTGTGNALNVELREGPALILENSTEVGPVTIEGPDATGEHIDNGSVRLNDGELNSVDRRPVDLRQVFFGGTGAIGALTMNDATLDVGSGTEPAEGLEASSIKLDSTSGVLFEIMGSGTIAQTDYSQLVSDGPVELAGVIGVVVGKPTAKASCPVLAPGTTYTFVSTTGGLSGTFADAPEDGSEIAVGFEKACGERSQTMRIAYNRSGVTKTVTGTVEEEAVIRKHDEEGALKSAGEEAMRVYEKAEAERKHAAEAAAAAAAQKQAEQRKLEEEGMARVEHEEEAAAATASVSLAGSTIRVQRGGEAQIELTCTGAGTCAGKLTLTGKMLTKKGKKAKAKTIGTATFSIPAGETATVKLALNSTGRSLLSADHGQLNATLTVLKSSPVPSQTHIENVRIVGQKVVERKK